MRIIKYVKVLKENCYLKIVYNVKCKQKNKWVKMSCRKEISKEEYCSSNCYHRLPTVSSITELTDFPFGFGNKFEKYFTGDYLRVPQPTYRSNK